MASRIAVVFGIATLLVACGSSGQTSTSTSGRPSPTSTATATAAASPSARPLEAGCSDAKPCVITAGTYELTGTFAFMPGMQVTVPDGWESREQDAGEFNLWPVDQPTGHILMVRDITATLSDGSLKPAPGAPATVEGLTAYWRHDPGLDVSLAGSRVIAHNLATTYVIQVSPDAAFTDPGCPSYPRCADLFTDAKHWGGGGFGIGYPEVARLYLATIGKGANAHVFGVVLDADDMSALDRLMTAAAPIIDSIRLPSTFPTY